MKTLEDLELIRERARKSISIRCGEQRASIVVSMGTSTSEARQVVASILDGLREHRIADVAVVQKASSESVDAQPTVEVIKPGASGIKFDRVTPETARRIVEQEILSANP